MKDTKQNTIKKKCGNPAWQKGVSGNAGGRPKGIHELIDAACKKYKLNPIDELVRMAAEGNLAAKDKVKVIADILDRRYGKALQTQDINVSHPEPISFFCVNDAEDSDNKDI